MMHVLPVLMRVLDRLVLVGVRVLAFHRDVVSVSVVAVIVAMGVLVLGRQVVMRVRVSLCDVKHHPHREQERREGGPPVDASANKSKTQRGTDEGREREHRCGTGRPDSSLRQ